MPVDVTDAFIHIRVKSPTLFTRYITKTLGKGIKARIGFRSSGGSTIQSYLFDKKKWTVATAKAWIKAHHEKISESVKYDELIVNWYLDKRGIKQ